MTDERTAQAAPKRKTNRQSFGSIRKLSSGRYQARYPDEAGRPMNAPHTFSTKKEATDHVAEVQYKRTSGHYVDHRKGEQPFGEYARAWIENGGTRGNLAPRTRDLYYDILDRQLAAVTGMSIRAITPETVRTWYAETRRSLAKTSKSRRGTGETRLRQSYALFRAVLGTAADDRLIAENPARIKRAGVAVSPERPYMSPAQFALIVGVHPERLRPALTLAYGAHLRLGELIALQRRDLDLDAGTLRVERQTVTANRQANGQPKESTDAEPIQSLTETLTTKTKTGTARVVTLPPSIVAAMRDYSMAATPGIGKAPLFTQENGRPLTRTQLQRAWAKARKSVGLPQFHLHDIRHAGLTTAAQAGATVRELMQRAGHRSSTVALTYQHAAEERGRIIAAGIDAALAGVVGPALEAPSGARYGTQLARDEAKDLLA